MKPKINIVTLGCSKNLVDSEVLMGQIAGDYEVLHDSNENADVIVINTCGFIHDAKEESIDTILSAVNSKSEGITKKVVVTGCLSERYKEELQQEIPDVDGFYGVNDLPKILKELKVDHKKELVGERLLTTPSHYAYVKISEGCNRNCSFCAIPLIRGKHISKPKEEIIHEVKLLANKGVKEIILIAQDLTWYGIDLYGRRELTDLVATLSEIEGIEWIRLHYTYPANFPTGLLALMKTNPKVCNYLDMPLQHISSKLLRSMKRGLGGKKTQDLLKRIKSDVPDIALRSTLIVGYPGETEEDFIELYNFVERTKFDRLGVFTYSPEEDTHAYGLVDDVTQEVKDERRDRIMLLQQEISYELNKRFVGKTLKVLIDRVEGGNYIGRTEYDSPEVDNEVIVETNGNDVSVGGFYDVKITSSDFFDLTGKIV